MELPKYAQYIKTAIDSGKYRVDLETGTIYGPKGPLKLLSIDTRQVPTVGLSLNVNGKRKICAVSANKVVAYVKWGDKAFDKELHVRRANRVPGDLRGENLQLVSKHICPIPREEISRNRKNAKKRSFPIRPAVTKLTDDQALEAIRVCLRERSKDGKRVRRGVQRELAKKFGVKPQTISFLACGNSFKDLREQAINLNNHTILSECKDKNGVVLF